MSFRSALLLACASWVTLLHAQTPPAEKPQLDEIIFANGEKLVGQFERASGTAVTFKSDMIGEVTVDWSKIQEVHTNRVFAVIPKNVILKRHGDTSGIPEGTLAMADQKLTVTPAGAPPKTVAVADSDHVVDDVSFKNAVNRRPGFFKDWKGSITAAAALIEATQTSETFSGAASLVRIEPSEDWLIRENRTTFDFSLAYGTISQPNTPEVKTDIFHLGVERDRYLSPRFFVFVQGMLDHNFSQGLTLQQTYGGGIGWSVIKKPYEDLDLKVGAAYIRQQFTVSASDQSLIAATIEEDYRRNLFHGMVFTQQLLINPALNEPEAFSARASGLLTMPFYKRLNSSVGISDSYLHAPPVGFKKNSFQFTAGLTYAIQ